jgi:hypothetical protein
MVHFQTSSVAAAGQRVHFADNGNVTVSNHQSQIAKHD